jgi:hypothetical protein
MIPIFGKPKALLLRIAQASHSAPPLWAGALIFCAFIGYNLGWLVNLLPKGN